MRSVYVIGSLRNPRVPVVAAALRAAGYEAFDDWYAAGPEADDIWQAYEQERGRRYVEGLRGWHAGMVFDFDRRHLDRCDVGVLLLPAGKSGHLELGYMIGQGKPGYVLLDGPDDPVRWDVMYCFAKAVVRDLPELLAELDGTEQGFLKNLELIRNDEGSLTDYLTKLNRAVSGVFGAI